MRKIIWCGLLGAIIGAAVSYLALGYVSRYLSPRAEENPGPSADGICSTDELHPFDALLPDPTKLMTDWQGFETLDLLSPQANSILAKKPSSGPFEDSFLQGLAPAEIICSADEAECFRLMPHSQNSTPLALLPRRDQVGEDDEEEEAQLAEPPVDAKIVEERLKCILESFIREGKLKGSAGVDTMEFRPSDAKKGEFDRIPF